MSKIGWKADAPCENLATMTDPLDRSLIRKLWHLPTLLGLTLLLIFGVFIAEDPLSLKQENGKPVLAHITQLSVSGSRYQGLYPGLRVSAQTSDGASGVTTAVRSDLKDCKVGDPIAAHQRGIRLYLLPRPCK